MSGGGAVRGTAVRARLAARLLAVLGCVLTAEAQVGTSGGWDDAAGSPHGGAGAWGGTRTWPGRGAPLAVGRAADPCLTGRRAEGPSCRGLEEAVRALRRDVGERAASGRVLCSFPGEAVCGSFTEVCSPCPSYLVPCGCSLLGSGPGVWVPPVCGAPPLQ